VGRFKLTHYPLVAEFANLGRFAHHYWFVCVSEALLHHRFNLLTSIYDAFVRDGLRAMATSKGEA
jgi:hypothetical protein